MRKGEERRRDILNRIRASRRPVSGTDLAEDFGVSRQVIVQDIALIRAQGYEIMSTNRGYLLIESEDPQRVFKVCHTDEEMEDELNSIVDLGGTVVDVFVWHKVYGRVTGELNIGSRRKVTQFMEGIRSGKSSPLKNITSNYHYHTISAPDEETLDLIQDMLAEKGYLAEGE